MLASFGVVVAIFQWGWLGSLLGVETPGPILSFMPIILMAVLFGLAMDYEVFLVSGMREEFVHSGDARRAVSRGFANGSRVVTAAALIMFFVFFAFVPEGSGTIKPIALGLAVGIAFDAFLVRMTLVPAIMTLLGRSAWWMPRWLLRVLPNMDIEGEKLREFRDAVAWTATQNDAAVSSDALVVGSGSRLVGPVDLDVPPGALLLVSGDLTSRRLLAATLAGRLDPISGLLQVAGHPLPSEVSKVARSVAMADVGGLEREETSATLGLLLTERLRLTQAKHRGASRRRRVQRWIDRLNAVIDELTPDAVMLSADSTLQHLPQRERAIALAAVACAEESPLVVLDLLDSFGSAADEAAFLGAVCRLSPASTTLLLFTPDEIGFESIRLCGDRVVSLLDLAAIVQLSPDAAALSVSDSAPSDSAQGVLK